MEMTITTEAPTKNKGEWTMMNVKREHLRRFKAAAVAYNLTMTDLMARVLEALEANAAEKVEGK